MYAACKYLGIALCCNGKKDFVEGSKILDTNPKIILLDH